MASNSLSFWLCFGVSIVYCAAFGCNANSSNAKGKCSFLAFPTDQCTLRIWIAHINRANFKPTKHSRLCSEHFEADCFEQNPVAMAALGFRGRARASLKPGAIPTLLSRGTMQPVYRTRKRTNTASATAIATTGTAGTSADAARFDRPAYQKRHRAEVRTEYYVYNVYVYDYNYYALDLVMDI